MERTIPGKATPRTENLSSRIESTILQICNDVDILGRLIGETYQHNSDVDGMKRKSYESLHCILSNSLSMTSYCSALPLAPNVQQSYYDNNAASPLQSASSSQTHVVWDNSCRFLCNFCDI